MRGAPVFTLSCGDVLPGCPERFEAPDEDDLMSQVATHAAEAHGITTITPEVLVQVQEQVVRPDRA